MYLLEYFDEGQRSGFQTFICLGSGLVSAARLIECFINLTSLHRRVNPFFEIFFGFFSGIR
ncbi:MAG: hypothetical protein KatS3mg067_0377 [Thermosynechococcus sp.]|nr:MAG: hypothetical protein KatS3mg067_0377 [Thermosynechococcus sp.]